jgi:hypothetical protein
MNLQVALQLQQQLQTTHRSVHLLSPQCIHCDERPRYRDLLLDHKREKPGVGRTHLAGRGGGFGFP